MASFVHLIDQRRLIGPGGSTVAGDIYFYYTGTSVLAPVYLDVGMTVPSPNPVEVGAGEIVPLIFLDDTITYRRVIQYSDGTLDEQDPLGALFSEGELGLPVGAIIDFSGPIAPEGFLFCSGEAVSRATYPDLFAAIGVTYGAGNGSTTFNLPDARGRVFAGKDNMGGVASGRLTSLTQSASILGAAGGEDYHTLSSLEMPLHNHGVNDPGHSHTFVDTLRNSGGTGNTTAGGVISAAGNTTSVNFTNITTQNAGGGNPHTNTQPTIVVNKIIKATTNTFLSLIGLFAPGAALPILNPVDFGIKFDGVTDDTEGWNAMIARINDFGVFPNGCAVILPPGTSRIVGATYTITNNLTVWGQGSNVSILRMESNSRFRLTGSRRHRETDFNTQFTLRDFSFQMSNIHTSGPLYCDYSAPYTGEGGLTPTLTMDNMSITGVSNATGFFVGLDLVNCPWPKLTNIVLRGDQSMNAGAGILYTGVDGSPSFVKVRGYYLNDFIRCEGEMEGYVMQDLEAVVCQRGVTVKDTSSGLQPLLTITNSHLNCEEYCVNAVGMTFVSIDKSNVFYGNGARYSATTWTCVDITPTLATGPVDALVCSADIQPVINGAGGFAATKIGIRIRGAAVSLEDYILGGRMEFVDYGIQLDTNTNGVKINADYYPRNVSIPLQDNGTNNRWLDLSRPTGASYVGVTQGGTVQDRLDHLWINVKDAPYNAKGDGTTDDTASIQAAIDYVGTNGGGAVYFPRGSYITHTVLASHALSMPYSNVVLKGDGPGCSGIKAQSTTGAYGLIAMQVLPLQNGVSSIFRSQIRDLYLDGNFDGVGDAESIIEASGTYDCVFDNLYLRNTPGYCIGLQNGGHVGTRITNCVFEGSSHDAIDVKNNEASGGGSIGKSLVFQNLVFRNCCRGSNATDPYAVLDVMSPGVIIDNIHIESFSEDAGVASTQAGIRCKPGLDVGSSRGVGAHYAMISNVYITKQAAARGVQTGIDAISPYVQMKNINVRGNLDSGARMSQSYCVIDGGTIDGPTDGVIVRGMIGSDPAIQPYSGADNCTVQNMTLLNNTNGINNSRSKLKVLGNKFGPTLTNGVLSAGSGSTDMTVKENDFATGITTPVNIDTNRNHDISNNRGAPGMLSRTLSAALTDHQFMVASTFRFSTGYNGSDPATAVDQVRVSHVANAVNSLQFQGAGTGGPVIITAAGSDATRHVRIQGAGTGGSAQLGASSGNVGFYGSTGAAKQTVSGAKGSNAALGSLLTALAAYGLITDTTTA